MKATRIQDVQVDYLDEDGKLRLEVRVLAFNLIRQDTYWVLSHSKVYKDKETAERKFKEFCKTHNIA